MSDDIKILVVDDAIFVHKVISKHLFRNSQLLEFYFAPDKNITCDYAKNGKEGIKLAKSNDYNLITLDFNMPGMDGYETAREIFKINPNQEILVITSIKTSEKIEKLKNIGIKNFLFKPFNEEQLIDSIIDIAINKDYSNGDYCLG